MVSYFARHEVDKQGEGWSPGEDGYPSAGRIAWALWGGDPGRTWAETIARELASEDSKRTQSLSGKDTQTMNIKSFPAEIQVKAASDDSAPHGSFTALVSVFNNTDLVGDRVMPGAFAKSLEGYETAGKTLPVVWNHDFSTAESFIGKTLSAEETDEGLLIKAAFFDTPRAQMVRTLLNERVVTEFSFAYDVVDEAKGEDGVNELRELHILEASVTLKGANPATQLIEAKSAPAAVKAEPGELAEGSFVEWSNGYGRVEYIMTDGEFGVEGDPLSLQATAENPLALVRIYQERDDQYQPTDLFTGFPFSELTLTEEKGAKSAANVGGRKAGRTLSSKNETAIREAKILLDSVLGSLESQTEPVKAEEPLEVKAEELGMDPGVAASLVELHMLDVETDLNPTQSHKE
jgi:HK97 family phage prohead protease